MPASASSCPGPRPSSARANAAEHRASAASARSCRSAAVTTGLQGCLVAVPGPDPDRRLHRHHPDLAVSDPTGLGALDDDPHDVVGVCVVDHDLDADLGHEGDVVLRAPVHLGVALLTAVAADL